MGFWFTLFLWTASFVLSDYLRPRLPSQTPAGIGDFSIPTATEGRYIPIMAGKMQQPGPNCTWYGDYIAVERTTTTGVVFKRDEVIGFTYEMALQFAQCKGPVGGITGVWIGDDKVWDAVADNSGNASSLIDINRPDLFGGLDQGGGFIGRIRLHNGASDQAVSAFLAGGTPVRQNPTPAYRGTAYTMVTNIAETAGAEIGESNQLRPIRVEIAAYSTAANGNIGNSLNLPSDHHIIGNGINPLAWAYTVLTDVDWGMGLPISDVNTANFVANAETCFTEGIGMGRIYTDVMDAGAVLDEVQQHIDGYIGPNPITGQLEVILARDDYVLANEFQLDASNIRDVPKWAKGDWNQTFNEVSLQFSDRRKNYKDSYAKAQSLSNRIIQGRKRSNPIKYPTVHDADVANKIVWREARGFFRGLGSGTIEADGSAYQLRPGNVASFTDADSEETNLPVRILAVGQGDPKNGTIILEVTQDVFGVETVGFADPPDTIFQPPVQTVVPLAGNDQAAVEAPYVVVRLDAEFPNTHPRLLTLARLTGGAPNEYEVIRRVRTTFGTGSYGAFASSGFVQAGFMDVGTLRGALTGWASGNGAFTIQVDPITGSLDHLFGIYNPGQNNAGGIAVIDPGTANEEWIAFTEIVDDLAGIRLQSVWRSCADTAMLAHTAGTRVWFVWTGGFGLPLETYAEGAGVEAKLLPRSPSAAVTEAQATALSEVQMHNTERYTRPLMPRQLLFNDAEFPSTDVSFDQQAQTTPTVIIGAKLGIRFRWWNVQPILWSVQGLYIDGGFISATELSSQQAQVSYWVYNLDTHPTPVRANAIITNADVPITLAVGDFPLARQDVQNAGITADFNARIEIETSHEPAGVSAGRKPSLNPLFFDFRAVGTFGVVGFPFSQVAFHSHFDAATPLDVSNTAATLTLVGNAVVSNAQSVFGGNSLLLDGTGDTVTAPDNAAYHLAAADFTIEARVRWTTDPGTATEDFLSQWSNTGDQRGWLWRISNNNMQFVYSTNGQAGTVVTLSSAWNPVVDQFYAIAVCRIGNNLRMFVDGALIGTAHDVTGVTIHDSTDLLRVGAAFTTVLTEELTGYIDEMRLINGTGIFAAAYTVATDEYFFHRVAFLAGFNGVNGATAFTDESRHAAVLTFNGNAQLSTAQSVFGGASLLLDGSGDNVTIPNNTELQNIGAQDFCIELRMRQSVLGTQGIVTNWAGGTRQLLVQTLTNGFQVFVQIPGQTQIASAATHPFTFVADTWYHVAFVRQGSNFTIYVDGNSVGTSTNIGTGVINNSTENWIIGSHSGTQYFNGHMDEMRITIGKPIYTANFTPPTGPFPRV